MAQKKTPSKASAEDTSQTDPAAPIDSKRLQKHLSRLLKMLEQDLLARADGSAGLSEALKARHKVEVEAERTADGYDAWRRGVVTQVAAAWVLNAVFVRILEDRGLIENARIAGPGALASERQFLELAPYLTERDYLLTVFRELSHFQVTRDLFDPQKNLANRITPSADGAKQLLAAFRLGSAEAPTFRFGQSSTRFLGDLYEHLSEAVRKKYALRQTPPFVEAFILDRTLEPALETYGLDATTLIDPTCGSGHFLLGAFERLFDRQQREHPNRNERDAALAAIDVVHGTDINPYAVSIAKFRLVLAFMEKAGFTKLSAAPALSLNVAIADSLCHYEGNEHQTESSRAHPGAVREWRHEVFALQENPKAARLLGQRYSAVVGNPPYTMVDDDALCDLYRRQYRSASGKYSLAAPFVERFFGLCERSAFCGMITAATFATREFGRALTTGILPTLDLCEVINTSGAYIPGHEGIQTLLMFGRNRPPERGTVRTVLAKRGEPGTPDEAARGKVWGSIADHANDLAFENDYISVTETSRDVLARHPWCLSGGGAVQLKALLESRAQCRLRDIVASVGFMVITGSDQAFVADSTVFGRHGLPCRPLGTGEAVRDWSVTGTEAVLFPYSDNWVAQGTEEVVKWLWPYRTGLSSRLMFHKTQLEAGLEWFEYRHLAREKVRASLCIAFPEQATHNHFCLKRDDTIFNQTAPIIKLPDAATDDDWFALLAYINSSTACFWLKQVCTPKGMNNRSRANATPYLVRYVFGCKKVGALPIPSGYDAKIPQLAAFGREIHCELQRRAAVSHTDPEDEVVRREDHLRRAVALQEELDWYVYSVFGLSVLETLEHHAVGAVTLGQRPFEQMLDSAHDYFRDHKTKREAPLDCGTRQGALYLKRVEAIRRGQVPSLLESPEMKRRWVQPRGKAARQLESDAKIVADRGRSKAVQAVERGAQQAGVGAFTADAVLRHIDCAKFESEPQHGLPMAEFVATQLDASSVPYLSALTFTASGIEKLTLWRRAWAMQRKCGAATDLSMVPEFTEEDYRGKYFGLRGKLGVPHERYIYYFGCESDDDHKAVYGWAGWNHLERAQVLAALYEARKDEGWGPGRLLPMLVGLIELLPWLYQYYAQPDESLGGERPADQFEAFVADELRLAGKTREQAERDVIAWAQQRGSGSKKKAIAKKGQEDDESVEDTDADTDESLVDAAAASASQSLTAPVKPLSKAKSRSRDKAANDVDTDDAGPSAGPASSTRPAPKRAAGGARTKAHRSSKGGGR